MYSRSLPAELTVLEFHLEILGSKELEAKLLAKAAEVDHLIERAILDSSLFIDSEAKARAGYRTGNLRRNIGIIQPHHTTTGTIEGGVGVGRQAYYGIWTHEGTGIFGHHRRPIYPVTGNVLVFKIGGRLVFARSVKGQRANPFMRDAFQLAAHVFMPMRVRKLAKDIGDL